MAQLFLLSLIIGTIDCFLDKSIIDSKEIDDVLSLVEENLKELNEIASSKRSTVGGDKDGKNRENCVQRCRAAFTKSLDYRNVDDQKFGAEVFVKCFPACFFPSNPVPKNPVECKHLCSEGFNGCYLKADNVEAFTCVLGNDQCESQCNEVRDIAEKKAVMYSGANRCLDGCGKSFSSCVGFRTKTLDKKHYITCEQVEMQCNRQCTKTRFI